MVWIDRDIEQVGDIGFVVERERTVRPLTTRRYMTRRPPITNQSGVERLAGWCGTTDDVATHALGVGRVTKVSKGGDRVLVTMLDGADLWAALVALGYEHLAPEPTDA